MAASVKKIAMLAFFCVLVALIWFFFIPYVRRLSEDSLERQIELESVTVESRPIEIMVGTTTLNIFVAATESERQRGLSGQSFIPEDQGLLFVFEELGYPGIWMKDMFFPIDIAWLDQDFRIVDIKSNVSPNTYPTAFRPELPAMYVLEVNAGFFAANNIKQGSMLHLVSEGEI